MSTNNRASQDPMPTTDRPKVTRGRHAGKVLRVSLAMLRQITGKTQVSVADGSDIRQGDVSTLENREDLGGVRLDTLRRYVAALGGEMEIGVVVGGRRYIITGAQSHE